LLQIITLLGRYRVKALGAPGSLQGVPFIFFINFVQMAGVGLAPAKSGREFDQTYWVPKPLMASPLLILFQQILIRF